MEGNPKRAAMTAKMLLIQHELECLYPLPRALECPFQHPPSAWLSALCEGFTVAEGKQACIHSPPQSGQPPRGPEDLSHPLAHLPRESLKLLRASTALFRHRKGGLVSGKNWELGRI